METLTLDRDGAERVPAALDAHQCAKLAHLLCRDNLRPGRRLFNIAGLASWLVIGGPIGKLAADHLGALAKPVRAVLFDKRADRNWALGWHQDRTIAVREKIASPGFSNWTVKQGVTHVAPPFSLLARMLTMRIHFDPVDAANAPLLVIPGSHRRYWQQSEIDNAVRAYCPYLCLADRGDIWLYSTPILHASDAAAQPSRRRVLQIDYSADALPGALEWMGI